MNEVSKQVTVEEMIAQSNRHLDKVLDVLRTHGTSAEEYTPIINRPIVLKFLDSTLEIPLNADTQTALDNFLQAVLEDKNYEGS